VAATYVTRAALVATLGIGSLYDSQTPEPVELTCQSAQDLIDTFLDYDSAPVIGASLTSNVAMLALDTPAHYVVGQVVVVSGCGSIYNSAAATITDTLPSTNLTNGYYNAYPTNRGVSFIKYAVTHADDPFHSVVPSGKVLGPDTKTATYATTPCVQQAAMMLAIDIWQARQAPASGGGSPDGMAPSPYRMGNNLMGKIRGLLAPVIDTGSLVG
jgi:hypothetical protein